MSASSRDALFQPGDRKGLRLIKQFVDELLGARGPEVADEFGAIFRLPVGQRVPSTSPSEGESS